MSPINRKFQSHLDINKHFFSVAGGLPLNEFIRHFEPAFYQPIILDQGKLLKDIDNITVQLPFLTKNDGEKWSRIFYFEIHQAPSERVAAAQCKNICPEWLY